ncbi:hypothetical protein D3C71_1035210 [compost metagenome]
MEALFLGTNDLLDELPLSHYIGIVAAHNFTYHLDKAEHERTIKAQHFTVTNCAAKQPANDISPTFVRWKHPIRNCK